MSNTNVFEQELDNILVFLSLATPRYASRYSIDRFQEIEVFTSRFADASPVADKRFIDPLVNPKDVGPVNVTVCFDPRGKDDLFGFFSMRSMGYVEKQRRGMWGATLDPLRMLYDSACGGVTRDGICHSQDMLIEYKPKSRSWDLVYDRPGCMTGDNGKPHDYSKPGQIIRAGLPDGYETTLPLTVAIAQARKLHWRVVLGYVGCPSVSFFTDPVGSKEIFRLRDIPEGKSRREALRNWVREHWRTVPRSDPEAETLVRKHLRGQNDFTWNGLRCKVCPSPLDVDANEVARAARKLMGRVRREKEERRWR